MCSEYIYVGDSTAAFGGGSAGLKGGPVKMSACLVVVTVRIWVPLDAL